MDRDQVWKNFDLGKELDISGTFIYNALRSFHEMRSLDHTEEIFEFLYNLAVGLERLLKVTVILVEHDSSTDQEEFEQSLITHVHLDLLARIRRARSLQLQGPHNELLGLLGTFYRSFRYGRFTKSLEWNPDQERAAILQFLSKHLDVTFDDEPFMGTPNTPRYREFVGNLVSKISVELYELATERARSLGLYTWERRVDSKAAKVFDGRSFTFFEEDVLIKELLVFFMNTKATGGLIEHLRSIPPLDFDPALAQEYVHCFQSEEGQQRVLDELNALYDDIGDKKARLELLMPIGDESVFFQSDFEEEDEEENLWLDG